MKKYRFHLLGLVHLPTHTKYTSCAFTWKNLKLAKMLTSMGHKVYVYCSEGSDIDKYCNSDNLIKVETHTLKDIRDAWGEGWNLESYPNIGYDWQNTQFKHDINTEKKAVTLKYYANAIKKINEIKKDDDFLLVTQGTYQKPISDVVNLYLTVEPGIGYRGSYCNFRAFESTYIQNFSYGSQYPRQSINGNFYDRVIPNYFDLKDFPFVTEKDDYFLFMGRLIVRKGLSIAIKAVEAVGGRLIVAGQMDNEGKTLIKNKVVEYVGYADVKKRADLMSHAKAVFTPSLYLEPFCGVHAESMLCGTPVITTNFGAFTDTFPDQVCGYRCDTLDDFIWAAKNVDRLSPKRIHEWAFNKFSLEAVSLQYQKWFNDLMMVYQSTQDKNIKGWSRVRTDEPEWRTKFNIIQTSWYN